MRGIGKTYTRPVGACGSPIEPGHAIACSKTAPMLALGGIRMQSCYCHCGARAVATMTRQGVLIVEFNGLVTAAAVGPITSGIAVEHGAQARAAAVDFTRSVLALGEDDVRRVMLGAAFACRAGRPAAVVVPAPHLRSFGAAALAAAIAGHDRRVFRSAAPARQWLDDRLAETMQSAPLGHRLHPPLDRRSSVR